MRCDEVRDQADLYGIGALDATEREAMDRHAESCAACHDLLTESATQAGRLGFAAPLRRAPADLRGRLLAQVAAEGRSSRRQFAPLRFVHPSEAAPGVGSSQPDGSPGRKQRGRVSRRWIQGAAAALLLGACIGGSAWVVSLQMQVHRLLSRAQTMQRRMATLETQHDAVMLLVSDGAQRFAMQSSDTSTRASGAVIWNPSQHKCGVFAAGLPTPPPDQAYHVWLMGGNRSWDEGELSTTDGGAATKMIDLSRYADQPGYQLVVSRQPRQSGSGEWQPVLRAWVGD
jgi:hypothetical protein